MSQETSNAAETLSLVVKRVRKGARTSVGTGANICVLGTRARITESKQCALPSCCFSVL
ncbi:MAG: hypothetical protein U0174_16115 [Polyangiaceae bacterium]